MRISILGYVNNGRRDDLPGFTADFSKPVVRKTVEISSLSEIRVRLEEIMAGMQANQPHLGFVVLASRDPRDKGRALRGWSGLRPEELQLATAAPHRGR